MGKLCFHFQGGKERGSFDINIYEQNKKTVSLFSGCHFFLSISIFCFYWTFSASSSPRICDILPSGAVQLFNSLTPSSICCPLGLQPPQYPQLLLHLLSPCTVNVVVNDVKWVQLCQLWSSTRQGMALGAMESPSWSQQQEWEAVGGRACIDISLYTAHISWGGGGGGDLWPSGQSLEGSWRAGMQLGEMDVVGDRCQSEYGCSSG